MNNDTTRFLSVLGGPSAYWHFQMFDDAKSGNKALAKQMYDTHDVLLNKMLTALNEAGAGVFVAVNEHEHNKGRTKKTTSKIRAIFADFDDIETAQEQVNSISAALEPTMVIESSPGKFHVYYVLSNQNSIPVSEFTHWQKHLVKAYGSDPKCTDSSRVMRVPGFMHNKKDPHPVKLLHCSGKKYDLDDLVSAFYGGRNNYLTSVAGKWRRDGLPVEEIVGRVAEVNTFLRTPLDEDEVDQICANMNNYAPDPVKAEAYNLAQLSQQLGLKLDKEHRLLPFGTNLRKLVEHDKEASGMVVKNLLTNHPEVTAGVPWARNGLSIEWTDTDTIYWRHYLISRYGDVEWNRSDVWDIWEELQTKNTYDPLQDYLNSVTWDGKERAATLFIRHLGAEDNEYSRMCARNMLLGAVNRAMHPGCKHDEMVTFYGFEGLGKSAIMRWLCPDESWFNESMPEKLADKDAMQMLHGSWFVEIAELKAILGSSAEQTKAFLSATTDKYRPPYEKLARRFPRRCVFVGTTNNWHFLTENGQNRRFLPLEISKEMDEDAIKSERDQIWAEAVVWFKKGVDARPPRAMWDEINGQRLAVTDDGEFAMDLTRYLNNNPDENVFIARNFYLETVEGASKERWVRESRIHRQISNAARVVFSSRPEWEFTKFKHEGSIVRAWRKK